MTDRPWSELPARLGDLLRPGLGDLVALMIAEIRAEVPEYDQPLEGEFGRLISGGVGQALEQFIAFVGRDADPEEVLATAEVLGRAEHRAGRTLDALQRAYRVGARVAWRGAAAVGVEHEVEPATMYRLAEAIFAYIDRLAAASVAGFSQAASEQAGFAQARRHALVEVLVRDPPAAPADLRAAMDAAAWSAPDAVAVLVTDADPVALARRMPPGTLAADLDPVGLLVVPDPDGPGQRDVVAAALRGRRGALGPTVAPERAAHSARRARALWSLPGGEGLLLADDHRLDLLLAADPALVSELAAARLAPLDALAPGARARALETLGAWLDAHGDVSAAAGALHVHPQTVRYRLGGLRDALGDALDDPQARLELALAVRYAARTSSPPTRDAGMGTTSAPSSPDGPPTGSA